MNPFLITPVIQHYEWGKRGRDSILSALGYSNEDKPLAEAWFGTHLKGSSMRLPDGTPLAELEHNSASELLGQSSIEAFGAKIPFLFKVLSIAKPLSIQVHPDALHAARLHAKDPAEYLEANTKPEIAIAISPVRMLNGFKSESAIYALLEQVPEFRALVSPTAGSFPSIHAIASTIFRASPEAIAFQCAKLTERLHLAAPSLPEEQLFLDLAAHFPDDVGVFSAFLLNELTLQPGEGIFTAPGTLHAYLSGDLLECMKLSDLVIRAGLTPKKRDVEALLEVCSHQHGAPVVLKTTESDTRYRSEAREFQIERIHGKYISRQIKTTKCVELYYLLSGKATLQAANGSTLEMNVGDASIVPASTSDLELAVNGDLYRVSVSLSASTTHTK